MFLVSNKSPTKVRSFSSVYYKTEARVKLYCQENLKFRFEVIPKETDSSLNYQPKGASSEIVITRLDKNIFWRLNSDERKCIEQELSQDTIASSIPIWANWKASAEKIGEGRILNYRCSMYQARENPNFTFWLANDTDIMLKTKEVYDFDEHQFTETKVAQKIKFQKLNDALFEIPKGYKIITVKLTTDEDLVNKPPVTLEVIAQQLFTDINHVIVNYRQDLSDAQFSIFRDSIKNGTDLEEVTDEEIQEMSSDFGYVKFRMWLGKGKGNCCIYFDKIKG